MAARTTHHLIGWLILATLPAAAAAATTLRVPSQYATIADAIAAARNGDRIVVADGVYTGPGNRDLDFAGKRIRLSSANGPANCIIDCQGRGRAFHFHNGESPSAVLEGLTIQRGWADHNGGGLLCESSSPTIRNCVFRWNTVQPVYHEGGGAMHMLGKSNPRVIDCVFEENVAAPVLYTGGGAVVVVSGCRASFVRCSFSRNRANSGAGVVTALDASSHFRDCIFTENEASPSGGAGMVIAFDSSAILENCRFVENFAAGDGAGLVCSTNGDARLENCQFLRNWAYSGGGVSVDTDSTATVNRCVFSGNVSYDSGGGGGGLGVSLRSKVVVNGSVFTGNAGAADGGAMGVWADGDLMVRNSTMVGNEAYEMDGHAYGGVLCGWGSRATFSNCLVHANTGIEGDAFSLIYPSYGLPTPMVLTVESCLAQDGRAGVFVEDPDDPSFVVHWSADNFEADPLLLRIPWPGPDGMWGTNDDDYGDLSLSLGSPCIDTGDPTYAPRPGELDINGDPRVLDGDGDGVAIMDIGADEFRIP